jgi:hypothetical protein
MPDRPAVPIPDEFYVGYLPLPAGQRRWLRVMLPALLWAIAGAAALMASQMRDAGNGRWTSSDRQVFVGTIDIAPYPVLRQASVDPAPADGPLGAFILVEAGKLGGRAGLEKFQCRRVRVAGSLIHRDGRSMIELAPGSDAVAAIEGDPASLKKPTPVGHAELRGEIVDSKCFLGAMRPGDGKTHRACAQLCIAGGLPPMLVTRDAAGHAEYYLLTAPDGTPANALVRPFVAEPVEVRGQVERLDDLQFLRLDPGGILRL